MGRIPRSVALLATYKLTLETLPPPGGMGRGAGGGVAGWLAGWPGLAGWAGLGWPGLLGWAGLGWARLGRGAKKPGRQIDFRLRFQLKGSFCKPGL